MDRLAPPRLRRLGRVAASGVILSLVVACTSSAVNEPTLSSRSPCPVGAAARHALGAKISQVMGPSFGLSADQARHVRAVLVSVCGRLVLERYMKSAPDDSREIASVTKSFVSSLVGVALADGSLRSLDQPLAQLLPDHARFMTPEVAAITLKQLLTMTAGLDEDGEDRHETPSWAKSTNFVRDILRQGPDRPPGRRFGYSSATSHLLAAILTHATGRRLLEYAREKLFDPLGIDTRPAAQPLMVEESRAIYDNAQFAWPADHQGNNIGGQLLKMTPTDMLKLGRLYLASGRWHGQQVLPAAWVHAATTAQVPTHGGFGGNDYGYQWWVTTAAHDPAYAALGIGGQLILVVPRRQLVVVFSTEIPPTNEVPTASLEGVASEVIAPAVTP